MTIKDIVSIIFMPISILEDIQVPFLNISFLDFWLGFFIVATLSIPLLKFIFSMSDNAWVNHSDKVKNKKDK